MEKLDEKTIQIIEKILKRLDSVKDDTILDPHKMEENTCCAQEHFKA